MSIHLHGSFDNVFTLVPNPLKYYDIIFWKTCISKTFSQINKMSNFTKKKFKKILHKFFENM